MPGRLVVPAAVAAVVVVLAAFGVAVLEAQDCLTSGETDPVMLDLDPYLIDALRGGASGTGGRFGAEGGMANLMTETAFTDLVAAHSLVVFSGPVVGSITTSSAKFWVRTAGAHQVRIVVGEDAALSNPVYSATVTTAAADDFTAELEVTGLSPFTQYHYDVLLDAAGTQGPTYPVFRTAPSSGQQVAFSVGFGGGARYNPPKEPIWATIEALDPLAFLFLGDNVYIDMPERRDVQRLMYYRRQLRAEYRSFAASAAIYSIWDDHDFGVDDSAGGLDPFVPSWKLPVWDVYCENWVNPSYGGGATLPGCWYDFSLGGVDFFMTDGRYYRDFGAGTMLGPEQKAWLLDKLRNSTATFKVICSGTLWTEYADKGGADSWWGVPAERKEILGLIDRERIGGVILLSADRHRTEIWKLVRPNGAYDLYEFE